MGTLMATVAHGSLAGCPSSEECGVYGIDGIANEVEGARRTDRCPAAIWGLAYNAASSEHMVYRYSAEPNRI